MAYGPYSMPRSNPRYPFFAEAEVTLRDGTRVPAQLAELSSRGCYIDTVEPIPLHSRVDLHIHDGLGTCDLHGKIIYLHSGPGLGIFGMGVVFENVGADQHSTLDKWLHRLERHHGQALGKNPLFQV